MNLKTVVVATDFSEASVVAVETALNLAMESEATLYFLHVLELPITGFDPMIGLAVASPWEDWRQEAFSRLKELVPENWDRQASIRLEVMVGSPSHTIAEFAKDRDADMVVVGTHGYGGLARMLMGSTAEALLRESPCQVLVVKHRAPAEKPAGERAASMGERTRLEGASHV